MEDDPGVLSLVMSMSRDAPGPNSSDSRMNGLPLMVIGTVLCGMLMPFQVSEATSRP